MKRFILIAVITTTVLADVSHLVHEGRTTTTTPQPPPHPYEFEYSAGRFPGHVDRSHAEFGDGTGTVKGAFQYVDPRNQVRTVEYVADEHGFYPKLSHELRAPEETEAVKLAAERHFQLYNRIAESHGNPAVVEAASPKDSAAVERAKEKHFNLFDKIAADHARIGAEHEAQRLAFEATSEKPDEHVNHF